MASYIDLVNEAVMKVAHEHEIREFLGELFGKLGITSRTSRLVRYNMGDVGRIEFTLCHVIEPEAAIAPFILAPAGGSTPQLITDGIGDRSERHDYFFERSQRRSTAHRLSAFQETSICSNYR
jgi:hypothetical protein